MRQPKTNTIKKITSILLGVPAAILVFSEIEDLKYWWIQFVTLAVLMLVLLWNGAFKDVHVNNFNRGK